MQAQRQLERAMSLWTWLIPLLSLVLLVAAAVAGVGTLLAIPCGAALIHLVLFAAFLFLAFVP